MRDLLGVAPEVASRWDTSQREAARHVLVAALHAGGAPERVGIGRVEDRLAEIDERRASAGDDALGLVVLDGERALPTVTDLADAAYRLDVQLDDGWREEPVGPERALGVLQTFGADAGHTTGPILIVPVPRLPAIAAYEHGRLLVNPVLIAALEPRGYTTQNESPAATARTSTTAGAVRHAFEAVEDPANGTIGNPYSFYGSVAECAAVQRSRCEACLPSSNCVPVTNTSDGNAECTTLAMNGGRGYYLLCINAALAITSVDRCAASKVASCPRDTHAADSLSTLDANADFLDTPECATGLDTCLTSIFGKPGGTYPGPGVDAGTSAPPPRTTDVSCGNSCSNNNCDASPNCSCSGPSCNNSLSCDSTCASSNNSSGCGGTSCDSCSSSSSSSSSGGGGGTCSSSSSSGGTSSSSSCGSCSNSSSSGGGSCGGGNCNTCNSSQSSMSSNSCGSGGGKCGVARGEPSAAFALLLSVGWGLLPIPFAAAARRRSRRRKQPTNPEVQP